MPRALRIPLLLALLGLPTSPLAAQVADGIYADFNVGNAGQYSFTVALDIQTSLFDTSLAPRLVANFIRLAEGSTSWHDPVTGQIRNDHFFDGLHFYQPSPGISVRFGSRTGTGTDGPGYAIQDDFRSGPATPNSLYMDNDGPNTNGSRFFISRPINNTFQGKYCRIGQVINVSTAFPGTNGSSNVSDLSFAPGTPPLNSVTIRRIGNFGSGFDENVWSLPSVSPTALKIVRTGGTHRLQWSDEAGDSGIYYASLNGLSPWIGPFFGFDPPGATELGGNISGDMMFAPRLFYRGAGIKYPFLPTAQLHFPNARIATYDPNKYGTITYIFDSDGLGGIWGQGSNSGPFTLEFYIPSSQFQATLRLSLNGGATTFQYTLHFDLTHNVNWQTSPNTILNPSRLSGGVLDFSNAPAPPQMIDLFDGLWQDLSAP